MLIQQFIQCAINLYNVAVDRENYFLRIFDSNIRQTLTYSHGILSGNRLHYVDCNNHLTQLTDNNIVIANIITSHCHYSANIPFEFYNNYFYSGYDNYLLSIVDYYPSGKSIIANNSFYSHGCHGDGLRACLNNNVIIYSNVFETTGCGTNYAMYQTVILMKH